MKRKYRFSDPCVCDQWSTEMNSLNFPTSTQFKIKGLKSNYFDFRVNGKWCWQLTIHPFIRKTISFDEMSKCSGNAVFGHNFSCYNSKQKKKEKNKTIKHHTMDKCGSIKWQRSKEYIAREIRKTQNQISFPKTAIQCENTSGHLMLNGLTMCELYGYCIGSPEEKAKAQRIKSNEIKWKLCCLIRYSSCFAVFYFNNLSY